MTNPRVLFGLGLALVLALGVVACALWLPGPDGRLGHDYAYFLPRMLAGDYFFACNGPCALPWFSPAFGAGLPFYAHPANGYVSLPQWLSFAVDPVRALQLTLLATLALAFAGTWLLLRRVFALSASSALLGATLFALNGAHAARMLVGHLGLHSSVLAPLVAFLLLRPLPEDPRARRWRTLLDGLGAGVLLAYLLQSGNVYGLPPVLLALVAIACVARLAGRDVRGFVPRLALAGALALGLCAPRLEAGFAYLASFPREGYPLPGARDPWVLARIVFQALFGAPPTELGNRSFEGLAFALDRHEWEYGLGLVPLLAIVAGAMAWLRGARARPRALPLLLLCATLAVPFVLNLHGERWTPFLKSLPLLKSSSSFVRWIFAYVPVVVVLAALAVERLRLKRWSDLLALAATLLGATQLALVDRSAYARQPYDPRAIVAAWATRDAPPAIREVAAPPIEQGRYLVGVQRDDELAHGRSQMLTYEPLFGYRLEWFPRGPVHPGPALEERAGALNFHDPRAFLHAAPGDARPGAPIDASRRAELEEFLRYGALPVEWPARQRAANALGLATLLLAPLLAALALWRLRRLRRA